MPARRSATITAGMPAAIITGASAGIGRDFALLCAQKGYDVVLIARDNDRLRTLAADIRQKYSRDALVISADLSRPDTPAQIFEELANVNVEPEILINNAGFGLMGHFATLPLEEQMRMIHLNIGALTELTRLFLPGMLARRRGRILNVASTAAFQPGPLMAVYFATKAYVVSFSHAIHNEAREFGVSVTALCPGPTRTEFADRARMTNTKLFSSGRAMSSTAVARIGYDAMIAGKPLVVAGHLNAAMSFLVRFVPVQFAAGMARKFQESK
jgi:short-subunit dehydrogenase